MKKKLGSFLSITLSLSLIVTMFMGMNLSAFADVPTIDGDDPTASFDSGIIDITDSAQVIMSIEFDTIDGISAHDYSYLNDIKVNDFSVEESPLSSNPWKTSCVVTSIIDALGSIIDLSPYGGGEMVYKERITWTWINGVRTRSIYYYTTAYSPDPGSDPSKYTPDMATENIEGVTFNTWEEITANTPNLTAEKLQKVNASNDDLLHVNIVGKSDKTVPVSAVQAMDKSTIGGLHVFIGESDAVTFLNSVDYANYTGKNFAHDDTFTENSRTIDFKDKDSINATVMFHSLIAPNATAKIYKVVDGAEVLIGTASSNEFGGICFAINDLATYVIRY